MASRFCAACGALVLDAGDTFCGNCGSPLARSAPASTPLARPAAPSTPLARPISQSIPLTRQAPSSTPLAAPFSTPHITAPPPSAPSLSAPTATDAPASPKSAGLALLLEVLVPGAGVLYAGQAWRGIAWLAGTLAGLVVEAMLLDSLHPLRSSIIGVSYLVWLVVRCVLVSDQVETRNAEVRREPSPPLYSAGGAIGATVCAIVVALLLGSIAAFAPRGGVTALASALSYWGWAAVTAYWVALCRLPRAGAVRVCLEALGWNLLLYLCIELLLLIEVRVLLAARGTPLVRGQETASQAFGHTIIEVLVASLLGYAFALTFARWLGVRALRSEQRTAGAVALALLVTGIVALGYFVVLLGLAGRLEAPHLAAIAVAWAIGVPLVVWVALPAYAGWRALHLLGVSPPPAAPPVAPTPPSQPAFWPR